MPESNAATFDFGSANDAQRDAIRTTEGPLLITAGPGTGKTFTLINRIKYLISVKDARPENLMVITFTEKAAKELVTRISNDLIKSFPDFNTEEMYIGTFHQVFLRLIKENIGDGGSGTLQKNFRQIDEFEQQVLIRDHFKFKVWEWNEYEQRDYWRWAGFSQLPGFSLTGFGTPDEDEDGNRAAFISQWKIAARICEFVNTVREELIDISSLENSDDPALNACAEVMKYYNKLLEQNNILDFSGMMYEAYMLLENNKELLERLRNTIKYIMVDEYQDTNYIQEQLVLKLMNDNMNICVVGDDDQSLYRFRGATVTNIINFEDNFPKGKCNVINLNVNYRSARSIIEKYQEWITNPVNFSWTNNDKDGNPHCDRIEKEKDEKTRLRPCKENDIPDTRVVKLIADDDDDFGEKVSDIINKLIESGTVTNLNQVAFLTRASGYFMKRKINNVLVQKDYNYNCVMGSVEENVELNGKKAVTYAPRFKMYFERPEVMMLTACLLRLFPELADKMRAFDPDDPDNADYTEAVSNMKFFGGSVRGYRNCLAYSDAAIENLPKGDKNALLKWLQEEHNRITNSKFTYTDIAYRLLALEPFCGYMDVKLSDGVFAQRPARNISIFIQYLEKYEAREGWREHSYASHEDFFRNFLGNMLGTAIQEYEDESEYAPSDCISFMTIHQSKGLEFPVVIVDAFDFGKSGSATSGIYKKMEDKGCYKRKMTEERSNYGSYDTWRLFFTAFSRAQSLLVLAARSELLYDYAPRSGSSFAAFYSNIPNYDTIDYSTIPPKSVKPSLLKDTYAYTTHIATYQKCPKMYMLRKELGLPEPQNTGMFFGTLVHGTIEDVNKAVIEGRADDVTDENVTKWFEENYKTLNKKSPNAIGDDQRKAALKQVKRYVERSRDSFDKIFSAEEDVSLVLPEYIIKGQMDLIRKTGDNEYELVDFKAETKKHVMDGYYERYCKQLQMYAWLLRERFGRNVTKAVLYCTSEDGNSPEIEVDISPAVVESTVKECKDVLKNIMDKKFEAAPKDAKTCKECTFRFLCKKAAAK